MLCIIFIINFLQEANKMVEEANIKRMHSEKLFDDANHKVRNGPF